MRYAPRAQQNHDPVRLHATDYQPLQSVRAASSAEDATGTMSPPAEKTRVHAPTSEKAMLEPPLGQISNLRPATYLTDELFYDPNGVLVRTCISTPDKDWARRMPHRPWCNATEPPVALGCTHTEQKADSTYPMGKGAAPTLHPTYYASKAEERRATSCPAYRDQARLGKDPLLRPESFNVHGQTVTVPGLFPVGQKSPSPTRSPSQKGWLRRSSPSSFDHTTMAQLPPRALHHLWNGKATADNWVQRYTGERKIWAWNTNVEGANLARSQSQGSAWVCPWLQ